MGQLPEDALSGCTVGTRVAAAPVSFGVTAWPPVGAGEWHPSPESVLDDLATCGYQGTDLGPPGYLAPLGKLASKLQARGLNLSGGYVEIDVSTPLADSQAIGQVQEMLDHMTSLEALRADLAPALWPKPTLGLGCPNGYTLKAGRQSAEIWRNAEGVLQMFSDLCRQRDLEPCVHNEYGTLISQATDVERALSCADVSFCLDTGHCHASGELPLEWLKAFWQRLRHVHLKDYRFPEVFDGGQYPAYQGGPPGEFCRLGEGGAQVAAIVQELRALSYNGWVVVEQDARVCTTGQYAKAKDDQAANRSFLASLGLGI